MWPKRVSGVIQQLPARRCSEETDDPQNCGDVCDDCRGCMDGQSLCVCQRDECAGLGWRHPDRTVDGHQKDRIDKSTSGLRDELVVPELTRDVERPMSVPDPRAEMVMPDRTLLCGPWENAINHYSCGEGYGNVVF